MNPESSVSPQASGTLWYYADASNQPVGPLPIAGLEQLAAAGIIHARTKIIESGGTVWRRFVEIAAKPTSPQLTRWFYADASNEPVGPMPLAELQRLAASGAISTKTQVVEDGGSVWRRFAEIVGEPIATNPREESPPLLPNSTAPPNASRRKLTILALGFLYPVGLWMIWRNNDFSKRTKALVTSICSPIFLIGIASGPGIIATPISLFLLWVWLGKAFSKVSKIVLTAVCTLLFLPILLLHRQAPAPHKWQSAQEPPVVNESPKRPKTYLPGEKVIVAKGSMIYSDAELLAELTKATKEKDEAKIKLASNKLVGKAGRIKQDTVLTVLEPGGEGIFYQLEGKGADGERQVWCAMYRDIHSYDPSDDTKARAEGSAAATALTYRRAQVEKIAKKRFGENLIAIEVDRITGGPSEGLYNVTLRFREGGGWSNKTMKRSIETKMRDTYEELFSTAPGVWEVFCLAEDKLIDQYGQEKMEIIYKTSMTKTIAEKVNWKNKHLLDFTQIWKTNWLHPALLKE